MSTQRVMHGIALQTGRLVNTLQVGRMVSRNPTPRYETECTHCHAKRVFGHAALVNGTARCVADGCGREKVGEALREDARKFRARLEAEQDLKRQEQEQLEREADRQAKAEQLARQKGKRREFMREGIATGIDPLVIVDELFNDPTFTVPVPTDKAEEYQRAEVEKFRKACPDYYPCPENSKTMTDYLERNAPWLKRVSAQHWKAVYKRLSEFGLLKERPVVVPAEPTPASAPKQVNPNLTIAKDDGSETGWNAQTGQPLTLSRKQVAALSADEYRRFKRIYKDQLDSLPRIGPGPRGLQA